MSPGSARRNRKEIPVTTTYATYIEAPATPDPFGSVKREEQVFDGRLNEVPTGFPVTPPLWMLGKPTAKAAAQGIMKAIVAADDLAGINRDDGEADRAFYTRRARATRKAVKARAVASGYPASWVTVKKGSGTAGAWLTVEVTDAFFAELPTGLGFAEEGQCIRYFIGTIIMAGFDYGGDPRFDAWGKTVAALQRDVTYEVPAWATAARQEAFLSE